MSLPSATFRVHSPPPLRGTLRDSSALFISLYIATAHPLTMRVPVSWLQDCRSELFLKGAYGKLDAYSRDQHS